MRELGIICIEGPIGTGKTTLAKALAEELDARVVLEDPDSNPFLPKFYEDMRKWAFQAQVFFMLSRYQQFLELRERDLFHPLSICDYTFEKNWIFGQLTLGEDEFSLYRTLYSVLAERVPKADVVIFLEAEPSVLLSRVRKRGRSYEQGIEPSYLERLLEAYQEFFRRYSESPLLVIDTSGTDAEALEAKAEEIAKKASELESGREFLSLD